MRQFEKSPAIYTTLKIGTSQSNLLHFKEVLTMAQSKKTIRFVVIFYILPVALLFYNSSLSPEGREKGTGGWHPN